MHTLTLLEAVEHVELGEGELGEAVQPGGVAQHHAVEPPGTAPAPGDRPELAADVDEAVAVVVGELGGERSGADAGRVGLGDPDDAVDVPRPEPGAGARSARGRVGRRDVRIGAVVEVEERRLGALEQQVRARRRGRRAADRRCRRRRARGGCRGRRSGRRCRRRRAGRRRRRSARGSRRRLAP